MSRARPSRYPPALRPLAGAILLVLVAVAQAQTLPVPDGADAVKQGAATIGTNGATMTITQTTPSAVIHWNDFSIGQGGKVAFDQQSGASSIALNRVVGDVGSSIQGGLTANGRIFLVNPNGILFGRTSEVNVGGLVASAVDISPADFAAGVVSGRFVFNGGAGTVENEGKITAASGGTVALIGGPARNGANGQITADLGSVVMASGSRVILDFHGDGLTQVIVDAELTDGEVNNAGRLQANGGNITLAALDDGDGDGLAIAHSGVIQARTLQNRQGRVLLSGGDGTVIVSGGAIDASATTAGLLGGSIDITGGDVGIVGRVPIVTVGNPAPIPSGLDASGTAGGGTIGIRGRGVVVMDGSSALVANATDNGSGGTIRLFGSEGVRIFGDLSARGGNNGGNGGFIETSANGGLDLRGIGIDASAANGAAGTWLIDPFDVEITHGVATGSLPSNPFDPIATSIIQDGDINNALNAGSSVRITTGAVAAGLANDGDITFTADAFGVPVSIARTVGTSRLSFQLDANRAINGRAGFSIDAGGGPLDVLFNANANNTAVLTSHDAGIVLSNAVINTNGGNVWLYGQNDAVSGLAGGEEEGIDLIDSTIDTRGIGGGGEVRMRGRGGNSGVQLLGSDVFSGDGAINLFGTTVFSGNGVTLGNTSLRGTLLQSDSGNISITGLALQSFPGSQQIGVEISSATVVTVNGTIDIFGRAQGTNGPTAPGSAVGILLRNGARIFNQNGSRIRLVGESTLAGPLSAAFGAGINITDTCGGDPDICIDGGTAGQVVLQAGNTGASDALIIDGNVQTAAAVNLRPGGVDASGAAYDRIDDAIVVGSTGDGFAVSVDEIGRITSPNLIFGSNTHAGAINVIAAITRAGNLSLHNTGGAGGIALNAPINVGANTLALVSGGAVTQTAAGAITAGSLLARSTGGDVALSAASNNVSGSTLAGDATGDFSYTDVDALSIGNVSAFGFDAAGNTMQALGGGGVAGNNVFVRNLAGDMTLNAGASAGNNLDLVTAGRLQNSASATLNAGNRWRVWADTWIGETRGGLAGSGPLPNLYNCSFGGPCGVTVPAADNHFIYRQQPAATVTIGNAAREYGLANPAFAFTVAGLILGDLATNAISGSADTAASVLSNVGNYPIVGTFDSPAGYALSVVPGTLAITPATLTYFANPLTRFVGLPNGLLGGSVTGFRNADTLAGATTGALLFASPANELSPVGLYPIDGSGLSALNYVFVQASQNATALRVIAPAGTLFPPDLVREPPDNYIYDRNIGAAQLCAITDLLASAQEKEGDTLAREWSRVRSRPNLTNCVQANKRYGCSDF